MGKKTGNTIEVYTADEDGLAHSIRIDCKDENLETLGCYMSLEDMMSGLKCVMDDISKRYGIYKELYSEDKHVGFRGTGAWTFVGSMIGKRAKKGQASIPYSQKYALKASSSEA